MKLSSVVLTPLQKWHRALARVPHKERILPEGNSQQQLLYAWRGDKLLGAAAARAVLQTTSIRDAGDATKLVSKAVSNRFFASHVQTLLPKDIYPFYPDVGPRYSNRQLGTMVEAAVAHVHETFDETNATDTDSVSGQEAIFELGEWLVAEASASASPTDTTTSPVAPVVLMDDMSNPKGRLLELGGTVTSKRIGGTGHAPIHRATATWKDWKSVQENLGSKKSVEQNAAWRLLVQALQDNPELKSEIMVAPATSKMFIGDIRSYQEDQNTQTTDETPSSRQWTPSGLDDNSAALYLGNGESLPEWWSRAATDPKYAYRRALMAPHIFPDHIVDVQCWSQRLRRRSNYDDDDDDDDDDQQPALPGAVFIVLYQDRASSDGDTDETAGTDLQCFITSIARQESLTKVRGEAAVEANRKIAEIIHPS